MSELFGSIKIGTPPYDGTDLPDFLGKTSQITWDTMVNTEKAAQSVDKTGSTIPKRARLDSLYHFVKGQKNKSLEDYTGNEKHLFAQFEDTDVKAFDVPLPSTPISGYHVLKDFDPANIDLNKVDSQIPASWGSNIDFCMYSARTEQHAIFAGDAKKISGIHSTEAPSTLSAWERPEWNDLWEKLTDNDQDTTEVIGAISSSLALYIITPTPVESFNLQFGVVSSAGSGVGVWYWTKNGFVSGTSIVDGTNVFHQDGSISFERTAGDEIPGFFFGQYGYVYAITAGSAISATTSLWNVTYTNNEFWPIENLWNSFGIDIIEAQFFDSSEGVYQTYPASTISIGEMQQDVDRLHMAMFDIPMAIYIDVSSTPNTNITATIKSIKYHVEKTDANAVTIPFYDGTDGLTKSGWIYFDEDVVRDMRRTVFHDNKNDLYWIYFDIETADVADGVVLGILSAPIYNILDFGHIGETNVAWKGRSLYTYEGFPNIYVSQLRTVNVLNGSDFAILQPGDGRNNRVTCMKNFQNEILVWQEEVGKEGGCITLFEGYNPATFGRLVLSTKIGTFNSKSAVVVDSSLTTTNVDDKNQMIAYFISRYGVFMTNGSTVMRISQDIDNYFDNDFAECLRVGFENYHWIEFDENRQAIRLGIVSGKNATECNIFPVYNLNDGTWTFDVYGSGRQPSCMINADGAKNMDTDFGNSNIAVESDDRFPVYQYGGSAFHSSIYRMNKSMTDDGYGIPGAFRIELNGSGYLLDLREVYMRARSQDTGVLDKEVYENGIIQLDDNAVIDLQPEVAGEESRRHWILQRNYITPSISILMEQLDEDVEPGDPGTTFYIYDLTTDCNIEFHK